MTDKFNSKLTFSRNDIRIYRTMAGEDIFVFVSRYGKEKSRILHFRNGDWSNFSVENERLRVPKESDLPFVLDYLQELMVIFRGVR